MTQQMSFAMENQKRIEAVERSFRPLGSRLVNPDRVLVGEGRLMKQSRRGPQPKAFFLFNDMLVYGRIVINGCWFTGQKVIPLENIELEDMENGRQMRHQWLLKTPQKSFYVSAASDDEKRAWMEHIELCKARLLQNSSRRARSTFAVTWIPDPVSAICMRCSTKFTVTHRRHHCRNCGFLVCSVCSRKRAVIGHIHPTKRLRVCKLCHGDLSDEVRGHEVRGRKVRSIGQPDPKNRNSSELEGDEQSFDEQQHDDEDEDSAEEDYAPIYWADPDMDSFSSYVFLKPEHVWAPQ